MTKFDENYTLFEDRPRIYEGLFVSKYLAVLRDGKEPGDFAPWINEVSKNALLAVDIVDDNNEVVFTVPPLQYSFNTTVGGWISDVLVEAEQIKNHYAPAAQAFLENGLNGVMVAEPTPPEDLAVWEQLFRRYAGGKVHKEVKQIAPVTREEYDEEPW